MLFSTVSYQTTLNFLDNTSSIAVFEAPIEAILTEARSASVMTAASSRWRCLIKWGKAQTGCCNRGKIGGSCRMTDKETSWPQLTDTKHWTILWVAYILICHHVVWNITRVWHYDCVSDDPRHRYNLYSQIHKWWQGECCECSLACILVCYCFHSRITNVVYISHKAESWNLGLLAVVHIYRFLLSYSSNCDYEMVCETQSCCQDIMFETTVFSSPVFPQQTISPDTFTPF